MRRSLIAWFVGGLLGLGVIAIFGDSWGFSEVWGFVAVFVYTLVVGVIVFLLRAFDIIKPSD